MIKLDQDFKVTRRDSIKTIASLALLPTLDFKHVSIAHKIGYFVTDSIIAKTGKKQDVIEALQHINLFDDPVLIKENRFGFYGWMEYPYITPGSFKSSDGLYIHSKPYTFSFDGEFSNSLKNCKERIKKYKEINNHLLDVYSDAVKYILNLKYEDILKIDRKIAAKYMKDLENYYANLG